MFAAWLYCYDQKCSEWVRIVYLYSWNVSELELTASLFFPLFSILVMWKSKPITRAHFIFSSIFKWLSLVLGVRWNFVYSCTKKNIAFPYIYIGIHWLILRITWGRFYEIFCTIWPRTKSSRSFQTMVTVIWMRISFLMFIHYYFFSHLTINRLETNRESVYLY